MDVPVTRTQDRWPLRFAALLLAAAAAWWVGRNGSFLASLKVALPVAGLLIVSIGLAAAASRLPDGKILARLCSALVWSMRFIAICIALPELVASQLPMRWDVVFRLTLPKDDCPIYYRLPDATFDGGRFVKRRGPDSWTGRPLNAALQMKHSRDVAYADEKRFTVRYDRDGFRNPADLSDWDLAICGDSFVELGSLPDGETITDQISTLTELRVKNLGVASTAPQNQAAFLRHFGHAPSCSRALLVWSEIALPKTTEEWTRLRESRPPHLGKADNSFLRAAWSAMRARLSPDHGTRLYANANFTDASNSSVPVMLDPPYPPSPDALTRSDREALNTALHDWAVTCARLKMEPWFLFLPSKIRVWQGRLAGDASLLTWTPNELPQHIEQLCKQHGIRFVDATSVLRDASQRGELVFNPVVDGHPTKLGASLIAKTVADAILPSADQSDQGSRRKTN